MIDNGIIIKYNNKINHISLIQLYTKRRMFNQSKWSTWNKIRSNKIVVKSIKTKKMINKNNRTNNINVIVNDRKVIQLKQNNFNPTIKILIQS